MVQLLKVFPGDLITAKQFNDMIDELARLGSIIDSLSLVQSDQVVILDLVPPSGAVKVGSELQVLGRNFRFVAGGLKLYIGDTQITLFKSATDEKLVFDIPSSFSALSLPQTLLLTVNNDRTSAQRTVTILPAISLSGSADVIFRGTSPTTPTENVAFRLEYKLKSRASANATFVIDPIVTVAANQSQWQNNVQVLDADGTTVNTTRQVPVDAGLEKTFFVRINPIPSGTNTTPFTLTVSALAGTVSGSAGAQNFTVGTAAPQPDNTMTLTFATAEVHPSASDGTVTATDIRLKSNADTTVSLSGTFTVATSYTITTQLVDGATNWNVALLSSTPSPFTVTSGELANIEGLARKTLQIGVQRAPSATEGAILFKVLRQGQTTPNTYRMALKFAS